MEKEKECFGLEFNEKQYVALPECCVRRTTLLLLSMSLTLTTIYAWSGNTDTADDMQGIAFLVSADLNRLKVAGNFIRTFESRLRVKTEYREEEERNNQYLYRLLSPGTGRQRPKQRTP
jgi:hypothetical protein